MALDPNCFEKVNLYLDAYDIPSTQWTSKSDCFAVLYCRDRKNKELLHKLHTTQVIMDNANPAWSDAFMIDYYFEYRQAIVIKVFHFKGTSTSDEEGHVFLGGAEFHLSTLMRAEYSKLDQPLEGGKGEGGLKVRAEAQTDTRNEFCFQFIGKDLLNRDGIFGKSDPSYTIIRKNEDGTGTTVFQSETIRDNLSPEWAPQKIPVNHLCTGDLRRPLLIQIRDVDGTAYQGMGDFETSVHELLSEPGFEYPVTHKEKTKGTVKGVNCSILKKPTFSQFIQGGCEISVIVALDFTGSNGDPISPDSLHHIDPTGGSSSWNPYQLGIASVCNVIEQYDTDKHYPVFGFGARVKLPGNPQPSAVQHCFPLGEGEASGVLGILDVYKEGVKSVLMSGPTLFQELIEKSAEIADARNCSQEKQSYTVLLVLTDGVIDDMTITKKALIRAANNPSPLSVLIVGVGADDFSDMAELDGDKGKLEAYGMVAERDLCQFIDMNPNTQRTEDGWMNLSQKILAEIPNQLLSFMEKKGIMPLSPA